MTLKRWLGTLGLLAVFTALTSVILWQPFFTFELPRWAQLMLIVTLTVLLEVVHTAVEEATGTSLRRLVRIQARKFQLRDPFARPKVAFQARVRYPEEERLVEAVEDAFEVRLARQEGRYVGAQEHGSAYRIDLRPVLADPEQVSEALGPEEGRDRPVEEFRVVVESGGVPPKDIPSALETLKRKIDTYFQTLTKGVQVNDVSMMALVEVDDWEREIDALLGPGEVVGVKDTRLGYSDSQVQATGELGPRVYKQLRDVVLLAAAGS